MTCVLLTYCACTLCVPADEGQHVQHVREALRRRHEVISGDLQKNNIKNFEKQINRISHRVELYFIVQGRKSVSHSGGSIHTPPESLFNYMFSYPLLQTSLPSLHRMS